MKLKEVLDVIDPVCTPISIHCGCEIVVDDELIDDLLSTDPFISDFYDYEVEEISQTIYMADKGNIVICIRKPLENEK